MNPSRRVQSRPPNPCPPSSAVVVVGFIGRHVSHLINRILDADIFGTHDTQLLEESRRGRVSYFHEEETGIIYLQLRCPGLFREDHLLQGSRTETQEDEFRDLQRMLFMFSVCHVIILIQEGSRLDTQTLKKFRILQAAKHAMAPYVKSQVPSLSTSRSSSSPSRNSAPGPFPTNRSPGRSGGTVRRNGSAISFMSGTGSHTSLFPGQCIPAILFIFLDDFSDFTSNTEESVTSSSLTQSNSSNLAMPNTSKGSGPGPGPVVVLARTASKSEGGLKKKLQSSLEAQIRFSIKKCRTLTGSEPGRFNSRGGGLSNPAPLFTLDTSKAVALLDRYSNQRGESLEFATSLVEDVLNGRATSDSLLLESHSPSSTKEDIISVREFIYKQADILRGRSGSVSNTSSGSVGMVAVAAAAAAASASLAGSGKALSGPELPGVDTWLSCSRQILQGILSSKPGCLVENDAGYRNTRQKIAVNPPVNGIVQRYSDPLDIAASCLDSGKGLIDNFSTSWCQRAFPAAKEVYLNELPTCYPTYIHETHMEKALRTFRSMVKGPSVELFLKKLEDECTAIWTCGRQLCDFISLTGKPCIHLRHGVEKDGEFLDDGMVKPHSSGFFFLQACACGRSRELHSDPFDFGTANITFNCSQKCCKFLPELQLPQLKNSGPIQASSWSLVRVGEAKNYEPSKGLLHSGFCPTQKFLLKWKILVEKSKDQNDLPAEVVRLGSVSDISTKVLDKHLVGTIEKMIDFSETNEVQLLNGKQVDKKPQSEDDRSEEKKIVVGRGVPNYTLKKPFSEVVAGSAAAVSKFPPLQSRKQPSGGWLKGTNQSSTSGSTKEKVPESRTVQVSKNHEVGSASQRSVKENGIGVDKYTDSVPFPELSSNHAPIKVKSSERSILKPNYLNVYVGFEHECPCGHRYILTPEHLNKLGSSYSLPEESNIPFRGEGFDNERSGKFNNDSRHGRPRHSSNANTFAARKMRNMNKTKEISGKGNTYLDRAMQANNKGQGHGHNLACESEETDTVKDIKEGLHSLHLNDDAFAMLNRNLPIYMNCPHCRSSKNDDPPEANFAGSISQLQRMFVVTPPFPVLLAACPVVQFEESCLPSFIPEREQKLQFSFECPTILPPESFLSLKLPFIYGVQLEDGSVQSLKPFNHQPELTAWINKGTILRAMSKEASV